MKSLLVWLFAGFVALSLTACWESETENKMEDMGEAVEETADDMKEGAEDAAEDMEDAAEDATDPELKH